MGRPRRNPGRTQDLIAGFEQRLYFLLAHRPVDDTIVLEFMRDGAGDGTDLFAWHARIAKPLRDIELRDKFFSSVGAFQRGRFRIRRIKGNAVAFGDRAEPLCRDVSHKTHSVRQSNAGGNAMRNIPARAYLMAQQVRQPEARVHRPIDRIPGGKLALPAMRQLLFARSCNGRLKVLHE